MTASGFIEEGEERESRNGQGVTDSEATKSLMRSNFSRDPSAMTSLTDISDGSSERRSGPEHPAGDQPLWPQLWSSRWSVVVQQCDVLRKVEGRTGCASHRSLRLDQRQQATQLREIRDAKK